MKTTIYDVAKKAGVSISTVSRVINNTGRISAKTKKRVLDVIEQLGYQPSVVASALTGKRTRTIGLIIPDVANPFFAELARRVEDRGRELGFNLLMCNTDNNPDTEDMYLSLLRQKSVDGIIIGTNARNHRVLRELLEENLPVALIAQDIPELMIDVVAVDDYLGGYQAAQHLVSLGHKRIAILVGNMNRTSDKYRLEAFRQALEDHGLELTEDLVIRTDYSREDGKRAARELLTSPKRPTAIFACFDFLAIGVYQAAKELGLRIPDDVSVVGFDNTILASIVDPPLTTIAQPIDEMGRQVMDLLVREIEGDKKTKQRVILPPELIIRQSTKPIA
ncbi:MULTISPECIES: LacI family DNA-binding transcriptional regulator [Bacillales]|jgi:LacI family transcriptional regulator|uniref:LacI family DNA-binding transcriptional regulator n=1 Tax=Brevibacillus TaxID=55080 RepID=UPI001490E235|nr:MULTISPECIES: LacI family DNA-binding transcriptional regulator [Bacillales]MBR8658029.1 LacI family DNA-binding transcriptional regulator [Brevibacillus sp. NL20B1]MDT3414938.1 LacI family transcriptional regulator [Brevibacillus aydinogluensis]NNV01627.1 LacI family transcriptional regulator [Brevibacillus sp. MCWH]UFJ61277.1 LacI family DNA-binding transcriptional regulator [Anoxybacillus sediminis]